uniref:C2 domain-containing protein n=1 Tax=Cuerna arida TaxID=1464854 RepID=A0A1B6H408_9HEMI
MFSRKKQPPKSKPRTGRNLSQYGLFDIPDMDNVGGADNMDDDDDDDELEAELLAITGESSVPRKPKKAPAAIGLPAADLDVMVATSLRDLPSDAELSGDDDDPDLLEELSAITGEEDGRVEALPSSTIPGGGSQTQGVLLRERLAMYQEAEANAKASGESAKARRFARGIKTLNELLKQAASGQPVSEEDIPPPVSVKKSEPKPVTLDTPSALVEPEPAPLVEPQPSEPAAAPVRPAPPPPIPPRGARTGVPLPGLTSQISFPETPTSPPPQVSSDEPSPTSPVADEVPSSPKKICPEPSNTLILLVGRRDEYKRAALVAKRAGDTSTAISYIKIAKQFDAVIAGLEAGQPVDLSAMPPPPSVPSPPAQQAPQSSEIQQAGAPESEMGPPPELVADAPEEFVVDVPGTVLEALEQRMAKYKSQEDSAKEEGNSSKARRMGRIVKQYADAIKQHKAGRPIPIDDLPTPPGYPPIPVEGGAKPPPSPQPAAVPSPQPAPAPPQQPSPVQPVSPQPSTSSDLSPDKPNVRKMGGSHQEKQLQQLLGKQKQFKLAALQAKKKGEVNQAKEYLRIAKGFDKLIEASNCGLPVDMATLPVPPSAKIALETDFDIVSAEDCTPGSPGSEDDILEKLEKDLIEQIKKSLETRNHFKAIGDVASANRFEQQALHSKKDLDLVRVARKHKHPVPRYHYETRSFSIVQCNTDLGDNDMELTIAQGVNYNVPNPKEIDTYIRFEFPWPTEEPYRDKTATVYNTNNPVYDEKFTLPIQRNVRACQRVFKRHAIKCEVWSKGCSLWFCSSGCCSSIHSCFSSVRGFFRGDSLIGTALVKLQPLETKCMLHETFDLMDGRKMVGGKLEVKVRLRNPIQAKQVERVEEKWLVIDH